tara:strand:+ start:1343 stop:1564 length:222 start_codon:yes stop_codon:yes gene_type:complete
VSEVKKLLLPALRQYQHNDCSGLVAGYEKEEVERIVGELITKIADKLIMPHERQKREWFDAVFLKQLNEGEAA